MSKNSFKELEELYIKERGDASEKTKSNIGQNINLFSFVSNILDLYIPQVGNVIMSFDRFVKPKDDAADKNQK